MKRVAVILSGAGVLDGSEIHEATAVLLALDRAGARVTVAAPSGPQLHVVDHLRREPAAVTSPTADAGRYARAVLVRVRGTGTLRARAGGGWVVRPLDRRWRDVRVPVGPARRRALALQVRIDPDGGVAFARRLGVIVRRPVVRAGVRRRGLRVVVRGRVVGCPARVVRATATRAHASARVGRRGDFTVRLATRQRRITLATVGTPTCEPGRARVTAPPVRR